MYFLSFLPFIMIRQHVDRKRIGGENGGRTRERSMSRDSDSGRPKHNGAMCRRAAHEAIGADNFVYFDHGKCRTVTNCYITYSYTAQNYI